MTETCVCGVAAVSGNDEYNIPRREGEPLSTACERANIIGDIPEVISYPGFRLVNGELPATKPMNGGIADVKAFFTVSRGCYQDIDGRDTGTTCL